MRQIKKGNAILELMRLVDTAEMTSSSKVKYQSEIRSFEQFLAEKKGSKILHWDNVTTELLSDYKKWLQKKKTTHKITGKTVSISRNTAIDKFKKFYTILTYADRAGYIDLDAQKITKLFKAKNKKDRVHENQVYLTEEEIRRIQQLPLIGDNALVRDLFIFQLETGQRYEDINGLNIGIGSSDNCSIRLTQQKTTTTVTLPLTEVAKGIISKYNGQLPKIPNAKANKALKHIAYLAGIRRKCSGIEHRNGELYRYEDEAWKFIGTHTARRSFVTINSATCTPDVIRSISGHKTMSSYLTYNGMRAETACEAYLTAKVERPQSKEVITDGMDMSRYIEEQKKVLTMLGADPCIVLETNDVDTLRRMLVRAEDELIQELGLDTIKTLKDIFNEHVPLHERKHKIDLLRERAKVSKTCTSVEAI